MKKTAFFIICLLVTVTVILGGCASNSGPQGPAEANPTAPDLRQEVDRAGSAINRPSWEK